MSSQATVRSSTQGLPSRINEDYAQRNLQNNRYQSQKPAQIATRTSVQTNRINRVKPMNSQSPVYQTNTVPRTYSNANRYNQRPTNNLNQVAPRAEQRQLNTRSQSNSLQTNNRSVQSGSIQPPSNRTVVKPSQPVNNPKPRSRSKNTEKTKDSRSDNNRSSSGSRSKSGNRD